MASEQGTYDTQSAKEISLDNLKDFLHQLDCKEIYVKKLSSNDNSKNQIYFGGHLTDLPFMPTEEITASQSRTKKKSNGKMDVKYQANINLSWVDADGIVYKAPNSKLIYYPQYPEVRFSGFLQGSKVNLSKWMDPYKQGRAEGRWLIIGVSHDEAIYAYMAEPESCLSKELAQTILIDVGSALSKLGSALETNVVSSRETLILMLNQIHQRGWIPSQKMNKDFSLTPYKALNGGGYTLEAMLGIPPNGIAEPDYLGWEVKQFGVTKFPRIGTKPTTLMTPEPNGGIYKERGVIDFVNSYGYPDKKGVPDRFNFGGKHIAGKRHKLTNLKIQLIGFDTERSVITDASGSIALTDNQENVAASWSFAKLMDHWKRKHSKTVYIPCIKRKVDSGSIEYHYGKDVELGTGTNFEKILSAMHLGSVFYDPGIKLENASSEKPKVKRRNQFRVNHKHLNTLYTNYEIVDVNLIL